MKVRKPCANPWSWHGTLKCLMASGCHQNFIAASWARAPFTEPQFVVGGRLGTVVQSTPTSAGRKRPEKTKRRSISYTSSVDVPCATHASCSAWLLVRAASSSAPQHGPFCASPHIGQGWQAAGNSMHAQHCSHEGAHMMHLAWRCVLSKTSAQY